LYEVGKGIIIPKLCKVLSVVNSGIGPCHLTRIGHEEVPIHWLSSSCSSKGIRFLVLDDEMDKGEGSEAFFGVKVSCMKGEGFK
jgi:hypothetical protein